MAMLALFQSNRPLLGIALSVAHCNFQLRGDESLEDERFVLEQCRREGLVCHVRRFDTQAYCRREGRSIEEGARILRYSFFEELLREEGAAAVATGHHAGDNAETVLFNLFRGASLSGLQGIRPKRGAIIRPLLPFTREELQAYGRERGLQSRLDASNLDERHDRNFIRNRVVPLVEERFGHKLAPSLARLSNHAAELGAFLDGHLERLQAADAGLSCSGEGFAVESLRGLSAFERKELFKRALEQLEAPVDAALLERLDDLVRGGSGRMVTAGRGLEAVRQGRRIVFRRQGGPAA